MLSHKNCGYAKYATKESAENAIKVCFLLSVNFYVCFSLEKCYNTFLLDFAWR